VAAARISCSRLGFNRFNVASRADKDAPKGKDAPHGTFNTCHGVWVSTLKPEAELYIADRTNGRYEVFDLDLNYKRTVAGDFVRNPCCFYQAQGHLFVPDLASLVAIAKGEDPGCGDKGCLVNGRIGMRLKGTFGSGATVWTPYLKGDVWWSTAGADDVAFATNVLSTLRNAGPAVEVGGGVSGQAGAVRHGISRALTEIDAELRGDLKRRGFLTRDARVKERKKAGLKKARKRPQFSKR